MDPRRPTMDPRRPNSDGPPGREDDQEVFDPDAGEGALPQDHFAGVTLTLLAIALLATLKALNLPLESTPTLVIAPIGAALAVRYPNQAVLGLFAVTGFSGSIIALTPIAAKPAGTLILFALLLAIFVGWLNRDRRKVRAWPALIAVIAYLVISLIDILVADPTSDGVESFRLSQLLLLLVPALALAPWPQWRFTEIAWLAVLCGGAVGVYGCYRWLVGPAPEEAAVARIAAASLPDAAKIRFYASQATAAQLSLWCSAMFTLALAGSLGWQGRRRLVAVAVTGMSAFLVIACEVRTGTVAIAVAAAIVLLLTQLTRALPGGSKTIASLLAVLAIAVSAAGIVALTVGKSESSSDRFGRILSPNSDASYTTRLDRWSRIWPALDDRLLGHGLGTFGEVAGQGTALPEAYGVESSFIKVGYEQGLPVMVLYGAALLILGVGLAIGAINTVNRDAAVLAIAAAGALATIAIHFYTGNYTENFQVMGCWIIVGIGAAAFTSAIPPGRESRPPRHRRGRGRGRRRDHPARRRIPVDAKPTTA